MATEVNESGAGEPPPPRGRVVPRLWNLGVDTLAALGSAMIFVLMLMICTDVVARNTFGASLPLVSELGALTVVMIVFLQLAAAVRNDRLASADFVVDALASRRPRAAALLRAAFDLCGAAVCAGVAWASWGIFMRDLQHREFIGVIGVATMQTSPFRALIFLGAVIAAVQFVLLAASRFRVPGHPGDRAP